jgi:hypothetical protein
LNCHWLLFRGISAADCRATQKEAAEDTGAGCR